MNGNTFIAAAAALGAIILAGYAYMGVQDRLASTQERIDGLIVDRGALHTRVGALEQRLAAVENDVRSTRDQLREVDQRATPARIAAAVLDAAKEELVTRIASRLATTREHVEALRGAQGEMADPGQVAIQLMFAGFASVTSRSLWQQNRDEILQSPELIAGVAGAVHDKFGVQLKGAAGQSADADAIARVLSRDVPFAQLVGELLPAKASHLAP